MIPWDHYLILRDFLKLKIDYCRYVDYIRCRRSAAQSKPDGIRSGGILAFRTPPIYFKKEVQ